MPNKTENGLEINIVGGRKGGVGKTFITSQIAAYLTSKELDFGLIEADATIGDVGKVYQGYKEGEKTDAIEIKLSDDPKRYSEPDVIFERVLKDKRVLVNLPAETNDSLSRWMKTVNLIDLCKEKDIRLFHWFVTDGCFASLRLLLESLQHMDSKLPHVVIRNLGRLNGVDFSYLDEEPIYQEILNAPNLLCVRDFPVLGSAEQFYLDKYGLTYQKGVGKAEEELGIIQAQRIKTFAEDSTAVLEQIFSVDIPDFEAKVERKLRLPGEPEETHSFEGDSGSTSEQADSTSATRKTRKTKRDSSQEAADGQPSDVEET